MADSAVPCLSDTALLLRAQYGRQTSLLSRHLSPVTAASWLLGSQQSTSLWPTLLRYQQVFSSLYPHTTSHIVIFT